MVGFASALATTIARPPTPPKENPVNLSGDNLTGSLVNAIIRPLIDTPEESPSSSAEYFKGSSGKFQKKVGFSPWTQYNPMNGHDSDSDRQRKRAPPPKDCNPTKSILKACVDNVLAPSNEGLLTSDQSSLPAMLRSTTLHLASPSRASRLDAYSTVLTCLSAYDDIPETQDLAENVVEITGYVRRDITTKTGEDGALDIQLATQALKVLTVFVYTPRMANIIPEDFSLFILERSISSIEDSGSPKILVTHYMHLLEKQKFSAKQMSPDRVNKLLTALDGVTNRIKGNRIVGHRLMIYHRLLTQAKSVMAAKVGSWVDHLVSGMLSSIKDIRARAIAFGVDAGLHLGTTSSVSQACIEVFNRASPEGKKFVDFLSLRLTEMIVSKEDGVHVPQIWSVVILLLRSRRRQLECWEHIKVWLQVIQRCFNSNDAQVKFQANIAWNRLIFAINLDTSTSNSMAKMLRQPIVSSLERKASDKNSKQAKQIARSSYCTLLYYAFRPTATHAQLDLFWDLYVSQILSSCFVASKTEVNYACDILTALLSGNGKPKVWDESRANVMGPMKPEELPCLDPKWVRLRTTKILQTFDKFLDVADWQIENDQESPVMVAWRSFTTALGNAGSKEVKASMETMNAIAHIINEVKRVLERSKLKLSKERTGQEQEDSDKTSQFDDFEKVRFLIREAVAKIGNIPFVERRVVLTSQDSFEASETPSSRSSRDKESQNSPTTHLLNLLLKHVPGEKGAASYRGAVQDVLHIALQSATSRRTQMGILRNLARLLSVDSALSKVASLAFWQLLAEAASSAMKSSPQNDTHNDSPQYPGHEYREAVKVLELGLQLRSNENSIVWRGLHDCIAKSLREEIGDNAVTLIMTEHLASVIRKDAQTCDDVLLTSAISVLDVMHWPQSGHLMERAQKLLWGAVHTTHKGTFVNSFENIFTMADALLSSVYHNLGTFSAHNVVSFLSAISNMVKSCPSTMQSTTLSRLQHGIGLWIEDPKGILNVSASSSLTALLPEVKKLWSIVVLVIQAFDHFDSKVLLQYQSLVASGLKSRHKSVLTESLTTWNHTFGSAESLEYPEVLRPTLSKLKSVTDLQLPGFPEAEGDETMSSHFHFVESQEDDETMRQKALASLPERPPMQGPSPLVAKTRRFAALSPIPNAAAAAQKSPQSPRRVVKTTPKVRLRHDDSQIQFAAIESSPLALEPVESQFLTDRQKEVKERQGRDVAAMFPEIRSSPRSSSRPPEYSLPKLVFSTNQNEPSKSVAGDESSPVFPPDVLMNDFLGSSPTPSSSKKGSNNDRSDDGPPSSPPFVSSHLNVFQKVDPPVNQDDGSEVPVEGTDHRSTGVEEEPSPTTNGVANSEDGEKSAKATRKLADYQEQASVPEASPVRSDERILSDFDVYVDAQSGPATIQQAVEQDDNEISHVTNSFQSQGSSRYDTEDDQVTAQLISEMERSSSQQSQKLQAITRAAVVKSSKPGRKRKSIFDFPPSANKKAKRNAASSSPQQIAEIPKAGEMFADCVMIDVRQAPSNHASSPVQIKGERVPSPSFVTASRSAEETPTTKRGRGRPRKKPRASQLSHVGSSVRESPRQSQIKVEQENVAMTPTSPDKNTRSSKTPRRSVTGVQQRKNDQGSQGNNSELDTDPLAPGADDIITETVMEGLTSSSIPQALPAHQHPMASDAQSQDDAPALANRHGQEPQLQANPVETRGLIPTPQGILQGFRDMLANIRRVTLGPEEERAIVGVLFESVKEVHEAGRRNTAT